MCGEVQYIGTTKTKFQYRFNIYKSKHEVSRKGSQQSLQRPLTIFSAFVVTQALAILFLNDERPKTSAQKLFIHKAFMRKSNTDIFTFNI